jgi:hypothetical protein
MLLGDHQELWLAIFRVPGEVQPEILGIYGTMDAGPRHNMLLVMILACELWQRLLMYPDIVFKGLVKCRAPGEKYRSYNQITSENVSVDQCMMFLP